MLLRWSGVGGTQRQSMKLSQELVSMGARVFVLTRRAKGNPKREIVNRVPVYHLGLLSKGTLGALSFLAGSFLWMLRHRKEYQIIHAHNLPTAFTAGLIAPLLGKKLIVKLPNGRTVQEFGRRSFGRMRWSVMLRAVDHFVAITADIEEELRSKEIPAERIIRIPNGVTLVNGRWTLPDKESFKGEFRLHPDRKIVTYLGSLISIKGLDWLLNVWKDLVVEDKSCQLLIIGDGKDRDELQEMARKFRIVDTVTLAGRIEDVHPFLAISDVFVLPSRSEGMSNALLEAMSHGLPVVATNIPGNRVLIENGKDGFLVDFGDSDALKNTIVTLLTDPDLCRKIGHSARKKIEEQFSMEAVAKKYYGIYQELITHQR